MPPPKRRDDDETVNVEGFGVKFGARGKDLMVVVLVVAVTGLLAALGYIHHVDTLSSDRRLENRMVEMIYVLSLPQEKRESLDISMPDSLRVRAHRRHPPPVDEGD